MYCGLVALCLEIAFKNVHCVLLQLQFTLGVSGCTIRVCCCCKTEVAIRLFEAETREFAHTCRPNN